MKFVMTLLTSAIVLVGCSHNPNLAKNTNPNRETASKPNELLPAETAMLSFFNFKGELLTFKGKGFVEENKDKAIDCYVSLGATEPYIRLELKTYFGIAEDNERYLWFPQLDDEVGKKETASTFLLLTGATNPDNRFEKIHHEIEIKKENGNIISILDTAKFLLFKSTVLGCHDLKKIDYQTFKAAIKK